MSAIDWSPGPLLRSLKSLGATIDMERIMHGVYRLRVRYHQKGAGICACRCHLGTKIAHSSPCCGPGSRERPPGAQDLPYEVIRETPREAAERWKGKSKMLASSEEFVRLVLEAWPAPP